VVAIDRDKCATKAAVKRCNHRSTSAADEDGLRGFVINDALAVEPRADDTDDVV